jgi:hypothetical protein
MHRVIELAEYRVEPRRVSREPRNRFRAPGDLRQRVDCLARYYISIIPLSLSFSRIIPYISPSSHLIYAHSPFAQPNTTHRLRTC